MYSDKYQLLLNLQIIRVSGADSKSFLQNLLTADVSKVSNSVGSLAGFCTPKGRLQASFWLTQPAHVPATDTSTDTYCLWISRDLCAEFAKKLNMYKLRSKVEITTLDNDWQIYGVIESTPTPVNAITPVISDALNTYSCTLPEVVSSGQTYQRRLLASPQALDPQIVSSNASDWDLLEVLSGIPRITTATKELFVPQMVNFESVGGVDFKKGCYPGQEIVARSQYLGSIKRRLKIGFAPVKVDLLANFQPGQSIYSETEPDQQVGVVVLAAFDEHKKGIFLQMELMLNALGTYLFVPNEQIGRLLILEVNNPPYPLLEI